MECKHYRVSVDTHTSVTKLPDVNVEPKKIGIYRYLSHFPKNEQRKVLDDLVAQGRVVTELTDMGLVGFVLL